MTLVQVKESGHDCYCQGAVRVYRLLVNGTPMCLCTKCGGFVYEIKRIPLIVRSQDWMGHHEAYLARRIAVA
jgi:hypothetical protein